MNCVSLQKFTMSILKVHAREIFDSRGNPTVEVDLFTAKGMCYFCFYNPWHHIPFFKASNDRALGKKQLVVLKAFLSDLHVLVGYALRLGGKRPLCFLVFRAGHRSAPRSLR